MKMKQYGVTKPKSLDYLLGILFALMAVTSLWVSIWLTATNTRAIGLEALGNFVKAISFNFEGNSWLLLAQSFVMYAGFVLAFVLCIAMLCRKKYRTIPGLVVLMLAGSFIALCVAFFAAYLGTAISGAFFVFFLMCMFSILVVTYLVVKLEFAMLVKDTKAYESYKAELGKEKIIEKIVYVENKVREEKPAEPISFPEENENIAEEELYFENSNGYDDSYRNDFERYNREIQTLMSEEPKAELKKDEPAEADVPLFERHENNYTFAQKLSMSQQVAKDFYAELKEYFESLGFKFALTKAGATFSHKNTKYAMIDVAGQKGLKIYYKLNIKDYEDSPIPVKYKGDVKKYETIPVLLVAKSGLAIKRAKKLMDDVKAEIEKENEKK